MVVREDDIERHDGEPGIFGVVEKPDFALVIPFDGDGFYVVEQYRYPVAGRYIEFPQGSWEDSPGADTTELARGELAEETGLRAGSITRLGHLYQAYGYSNQGFHVFLATNLTSGEQTLSVSERDAAAACRREEALGRLVSTHPSCDACHSRSSTGGAGSPYPHLPKVPVPSCKTMKGTARGDQGSEASLVRVTTEVGSSSAERIGRRPPWWRR